MTHSPNNLPTHSPYARALWDFALGQYTADNPLMLADSLGHADPMPVHTFFRAELSELDTVAVGAVRGRVLDVGAGAGCMSLILQNQGVDVMAVDCDSAVCDLLNHRGVSTVVCTDIMGGELPPALCGGFDTVLVLMNGVGIAGTLDNLPHFLNALKTCLAPNGQIIIDSTDIAYAYDGADMPTRGYYGELQYQYTYGNTVGDWFPWLYVNEPTLITTAQKCGLKWERLFIETTHDDGHYLGRLFLE